MNLHDDANKWTLELHRDVIEGWLDKNWSRVYARRMDREKSISSLLMFQLSRKSRKTQRISDATRSVSTCALKTTSELGWRGVKEGRRDDKGSVAESVDEMKDLHVVIDGCLAVAVGIVAGIWSHDTYIGLSWCTALV
ncbi:uncharacterized protein B0I36DRAFT_354917 [Microdochium trichocladiopsis]|uniref:Uncharacterized protein n=1 Tax=Microdochium trichocladiopsis TaxID=1682393 RepID=A0A9P9BIU8_9PEZI|nr:uncharacterized protein B0I36DRAFT_354917 [Microdochium trichocladiopsis]KAH7016043.1 hypothetical protein B0I36DRAFT_354917 [Microdochium trichocladiopsis]